MDYLQYALMGLGGLFFAVIVIVLLLWAYCIVTTGDLEERMAKLSVVFMAIAVVMCAGTWCLGLYWGRANAIADMAKEDAAIACSSAVYVIYLPEYKLYQAYCAE
jgi:hypothetical protein